MIKGVKETMMRDSGLCRNRIIEKLTEMDVFSYSFPTGKLTDHRPGPLLPYSKGVVYYHHPLLPAQLSSVHLGSWNNRWGSC